MSRFDFNWARKPRSFGFTLVEVSLALLVVAVGVLGAFALFPHGLAESKMAVAETQASLFAEMTLRSVRAAAAYAPWNSINSYVIQGPVAASSSSSDESWGGTTTIIPDTSPPGDPVSARTYLTTISAGSAQAKATTGIVDENAVRYYLYIEDVVPNRLKRVSLYVWPGRFGTTLRTNADVYVTQIFNQHQE